MRSVVNEVPKCMAPIANKPFLWYLLKYLTKFDVSKVILSLGYLRGVIIDWIDECKDEFPFAFEYAVEDEPLGTGGGIKLALKRTSKPNIIVFLSLYPCFDSYPFCSAPRKNISFLFLPT